MKVFKRNEKVYPFTKEGYMAMKRDIKLDRIGLALNIATYAVIGGLIIIGILDEKFIETYLAGSISSAIVKKYIRSKKG